MSLASGCPSLFLLSLSSLAQEALQENILKAMGPLEAQLAGLRQELAALSQRQAAVAEEVDLWPQKMAALRSDVSPPVHHLDHMCPSLQGGLPEHLPRETQPSKVSTGVQ